MRDPVGSDPRSDAYLDEKSARDEFTRVATVCHGCRRCIDFCGSFPTLFDLIEARAGDAGGLAPAQQDAVVDECFQCGRCVSGCPYAPDVDDQAVDVPRLVLRMHAMRHATGQIPLRARLTTWLLARRGLAAQLVRAPGGSKRRRVIAAVSDLSATRLIPPNVRPTFSDGFGRRPSAETGHADRTVTVFPTCIVEHQAPRIGDALVDVYERNGIACSISSADCCGAPWLHTGDITRFRKVAARNVTSLVAEIRTGGDLVVAQPVCAQVIVEEYPRHLSGPDVDFVVEHTSAATEFLDLHLADEPGRAAGRRVALHVDMALRRDREQRSARGVLESADVEVVSVDRSSGTGVMWGWRAQHEARSRSMAERLAADLAAVRADGVVGECHAANTAIFEQTGVMPRHPFEVVAAASDD